MRVVVVQRTLPHYRVAFFRLLRQELSRRSIDMLLIHGEATGDERERRDSGELQGAVRIENRVMTWGARSVVWQPILRHVRRGDLVVVEQANRLLANYALLALRRSLGYQVAFWGHGRNRQADNPGAFGERFKSVVSRAPDWWFAYTEGAASTVRTLPYPAERITVVQNTIDTAELRQVADCMTVTDVEALRVVLRLNCGPTAVFCGSIYREKRPRFLLRAALHLRELVPDFQLLIVGAGPEEQVLVQAAADHEWIRYLGPIHGPERARVLAMADVMLLPGLVGLNVVDAFATALPVVAVDWPRHSPEFEYLDDGNAVVCEEGSSPQVYAAAAADLLMDPDRRTLLSRGAARAASRYSLETMVDRFAGGVAAALLRPDAR